MKITSIISSNVYKKQSNHQNNLSTPLKLSYKADSVSFGETKGLFSQELDSLDILIKEEIRPIMNETKDLYSKVGKIGYGAQEPLNYFREKEKELFWHKMSLIPDKASDELYEKFDKQKLAGTNPEMHKKYSKLNETYTEAVVFMFLSPYKDCTEFLKEAEELKKELKAPSKDLYHISKKFGYLFLTADKIKENKLYFDENKQKTIDFIKENKNRNIDFNKQEVYDAYEMIKQNCRTIVESELD